MLTLKQQLVQSIVVLFIPCYSQSQLQSQLQVHILLVFAIAEHQINHALLSHITSQLQVSQQCHNQMSALGVRELVDSAGNDTDASVLRPEVRPGIEEPFNGQADKATMVTLHATCLTSSLYAFGYILLVIVFELCIFIAVTALDEINIMMDYFGRKALYFFPVFDLLLLSRASQLVSRRS